MSKGEKPKDKKNEGGRPTKYSKELAEAIALDMTHMGLVEACKKNGIAEPTYYEWLYKHEEFSKLSTESRKTKAIKHFTEAEKVLNETKEARKKGDTSFRSDLARLELDFHLRLAGKANQGLFGDNKKDDDTKEMPSVNINLNK